MMSGIVTCTAQGVQKVIFIITNKFTIDIVTLYIKTVCLCNLYCYMFRHFHVIIRQFTTNALLSYMSFFYIAAVESTKL